MQISDGVYRTRDRQYELDFVSGVWELRETDRGVVQTCANLTAARLKLAELRADCSSRASGTNRMTRINRAAVARQFGRNLARTRARRGLTKSEVSVRASLHLTHIELLEKGDRVPLIDTVIKLAAALEVQPAELLYGIEWRLEGDHGRLYICGKRTDVSDVGSPLTSSASDE